MTFTLEFIEGNVIDGSGRRYSDVWVATMGDGKVYREAVISFWDEDDDQASRRVHGSVLDAAMKHQMEETGQ